MEKEFTPINGYQNLMEFGISKKINISKIYIQINKLLWLYTPSLIHDCFTKI